MKPAWHSGSGRILGPRRASWPTLVCRENVCREEGYSECAVCVCVREDAVAPKSAAIQVHSRRKRRELQAPAPDGAEAWTNLHAGAWVD